jgi:ribosome recycling factor
MDSSEKQKLIKAIDHFKDELKSLKTGRANSAVVEQLDVKAYDTVMKLSGLAGISVVDARTLMISPWDKSVLKDIEAAIKNSDLGVNPNVDGDVIRLNFPPLTEEVRKELIKLLGKMAEETKVAVRNVRREVISQIEAEKKKGGVSENDMKMEINDVEDEIKKFIAQIEEIADVKEKELTII